MKGYDKLEFDVVIGNPPYQEATNNKVLEVGKQKRVRNVFQDFQLIANRVSSRYSCLIYPGGRWIQRFGKGLSNFGLDQINSKYLSRVIFYPDANEIFNDVSIADGISIVLMDYNKKSSSFEYI